LLIVSPVRGKYRRFQAETPLIALSKFPRPALSSGYGRFGGAAGIAEFTELRWITIETGPQHYPI
jgi:hypothetical protein